MRNSTGNIKTESSRDHLLALIRLSLWENETSRIVISREEYNELEKHLILPLMAPALNRIVLPQELLSLWRRQIVRQMVHNMNAEHVQTTLPLKVPYVILKGTAAACYYPHPEYRTMGDVDIMTRREDLETARQQLLDSGFILTKELNREICFIKDGVTVELHRRFATMNDPEKAKQLDDMIIDHINPSHKLPDPVNGLVILEHISQHMEGGLGLRQIIDWMMFADKCLADGQWPEFSRLSGRIGMENLAIITTRMCELYLGLPEHTWCSGADPEICRQLLEYVLQCGNFGIKKTTDSDISENAFASATTLRAAFKLLQQQGLTNWNAARKHRSLRPFAWIYQAFRYASRGLKRKRPLASIRAEYTAAMSRKAMFDALGVKTVAKGDITYKDGKYIKT